MRNNKGFSLVELIIVIAIMAILVGVMAPQLIKYIEKTNVSSDVQLCDSVKTAITTAMMDPAVLTVEENGIPSTGGAVSGIDQDKPFGASVAEILGLTLSSIDDEIKSSAKDNGGVVMFDIVNSNSVAVWITNSDATGAKGTDSANWINVD